MDNKVDLSFTPYIELSPGSELRWSINGVERGFAKVSVASRFYVVILPDVPKFDQVGLLNEL